MKIAAGLVGLCCLPGFAQIILSPDPLNVRWLSVPDPTKTLMRSGYDANDANVDSGNLVRVEPSGSVFNDPESEWVLFESGGPGALTSIWFTGKNKEGKPYLGGTLNFYFDNEKRPRISGGLPELLTSGKAFPAPLAEASSGGWVSYVPLLFAKSLRITLTEHADRYGHRRNGRGQTIPHLYHQFTYQKLPRAVANTAAGSISPMWKIDETGQVRARSVELPANGTAVAFEVEGKGIVNGLRLRWEGADPDQSALRIIADGQTAVDLPVSEFWGFQRSERPGARFESLLLGVKPDGLYYSYFPMPHRQSLRIELRNGPAAGRLFVEVRHRKGWPEREHFQFRAGRVGDTTMPGRDLRILEASGRGHFVGTILQLYDKTMEGDDRFFVDGEQFPPSWHGTGTEDYFRCGWYFHGGPLTRPLYGLLDTGTPKIAYRFHLADRVNFTRSAVIGFEHGHRNAYSGPFSGVVFWYTQIP